MIVVSKVGGALFDRRPAASTVEHDVARAFVWDPSDDDSSARRLLDLFWLQNEFGAPNPKRVLHRSMEGHCAA
jgi:hypothetical protein